MLVGKLSYALTCCARSLERTEPDSLGHVFCHLNCIGCAEKNFCLSVKRVVEEELNRRQSVDAVLKRL